MSKEKQSIIAEQMKIMRSIAKKNGWVFSLDKNEDSMFYSKPIIPRGSKLYQVTNEIAVFLDARNKLQGITMEYYSNNYVKHHDKFENLTDKVFNKKEDIIEVDPRGTKNEEVGMFKELFETTIIAEALGAELH